MPPSDIVCRHYQRGHCSYGSRCKFRHEQTRGNNATGGNSRTNRPRTVPVPHPDGVCKVFWTSGSCPRAFECTFKHSKGSNASAGASPRPEILDDESCLIADTLTALLDRCASYRDGDVLSPAQAMSKLEGRFTNTLRTGAQVCDFVQVIRSVHARNRSWVRRPLS